MSPQTISHNTVPPPHDHGDRSSSSHFDPAEAIRVANDRVASYLIRSGWGHQPARLRAERLVEQVLSENEQTMGSPQTSPIDRERLVRLAIRLVCDSQCVHASQSVIRPVLDGEMRPAMSLRPASILRWSWWCGRFKMAH